MCGALLEQSVMSAAPITRRQLIANAAAAAAFACLGPASARDAAWADLPTIALGRTGRTLPRLGFGAFPIGNLPDEAAAVRVIRRAIDGGVRYFDTAPSYGEGRSEQRLGRAFAEAFGDGVVKREDLFVATKTLHRDAAGARRELEASVKRLRLDYVDSVQCHEVHEDWESLFAKDSVLNALEKARDEGLVRHISITGHRDPAHLLEPLKRYEFASALVPVNPLDRQHLSYIENLLPVAAGRGTAVVAMKIYAGGNLLAGDKPPFKAGELLRYALSQEHVAIAAPGCQTVKHVEQALAAAAPFTGLSTDEQRELEKRAGEHRGKKSEWYKN